jgi:uncharacterized protein DUF2380
MPQSRPATCIVAAATLLLALALTPAHSEAAVTQDEAVKVAIVDFAYIDTAGEPTDQVDVHRKRLQAFMTALRADFERDPAVDLLPSSCPPLCADGGQRPADLLRSAAKAGAKILVTGGIQKLSTLVQWVKVTAFDVGAARVVFDKLFTFRGDSDEAWKRAEVFVSQEVRAALAADRPAHHEARQNGDDQ